MTQPVESVLNDHDGSIDHETNCDSQAPKRHKICRDAIVIHSHKCYERGKK